MQDTSKRKRTTIIGCLGEKGRFGNQIFQYLFGVGWSKKHETDLIIPPWVGCKYYWLSGKLRELDKTYIFTLPKVCEKDAAAGCFDMSSPIGDIVNYEGYFQDCRPYHNHNLSRYIRLAMTPNALGEEVFRLIPTKFKEKINSSLILHMRYGDYGYGNHWITPPSMVRGILQRAVVQHNLTGLIILSDDIPKARNHFRDLQPEFLPDLSGNLMETIPSSELSMIRDFEFMRHAKYLAIANSSFSYSAALLSVNACPTFYRPSLQHNQFVEFAPFRSQAILHEVVPHKGYLRW